jgi:transcriptional regulator with XRE-family HTH domain
LAKLADIDHAYIYRLETGDKESPSPEALTKLMKALKPDKREAEMLYYLSEHSETAAELVGLTVKDKGISYPHFRAVAGMAHRGKRPDYPVLIERVRRFMAEDESDG